VRRNTSTAEARRIAARLLKWASARKTHGAPSIRVLSVWDHQRMLTRRQCTPRGHQTIFPIITASTHAKEIVAKNGRRMATITAPSIRVVPTRPHQGTSAGRLAISQSENHRFGCRHHREKRQKVMTPLRFERRTLGYQVVGS
jgi:hypothetical protein